MKHEVQITFTVELSRDTDIGDSMNEFILADVALDQLIDARDDGDLDFKVDYL